MRGGSAGAILWCMSEPNRPTEQTMAQALPQEVAVGDPTPNYRQAGAGDICGVVARGMADQEASGHQQKAKARAYGETSAALGVRADGLTPAQREFAEAYRRRRAGQGATDGKRYGFRIDATGRRPTGR